MSGDDVGCLTRMKMVINDRLLVDSCVVAVATRSAYNESGLAWTETDGQPPHKRHASSRCFDLRQTRVVIYDLQVFHSLAFVDSQYSVSP